MLSRRIRRRAIKIGIVTGIGVNVVLWQLTEVSWLWWNLTGFAAAAVVTLVLSFQALRRGAGVAEGMERELTTERSPIRWTLVYGITALFFLVIIGACLLLERLL